LHTSVASSCEFAVRLFIVIGHWWMCPPSQLPRNWHYFWSYDSQKVLWSWYGRIFPPGSRTQVYWLGSRVVVLWRS